MDADVSVFREEDRLRNALERHRQVSDARAERMIE